MKNIVLTGSFIDIQKVMATVKKAGFSLSDNLRSDTSVLLVGSGAKSYFAASDEGKLIHAATEYELSGTGIQIIFEEEFIQRYRGLSSEKQM